jgi:hypothetical protein
MACSKQERLIEEIALLKLILDDLLWKYWISFNKLKWEFMSVPQISSILSLPIDLLQMESTYLGKALLPFRRVCKRFRDASPIAFEAYKNKLFVDRYGARANCEKDIPFDFLVQRIESAVAIKKRLSKADLRREIETVGHYEAKFERHLAEFRDLWLEIDDSQVPHLIEYEKASFFKKKASFLERIKTKYLFYRREFHRERDEKVNKLIWLQNNIATELYYEPFNSLHPLQDLRNRCLRLQILEKERTRLSQAMKASRGSYNDFLSKLHQVERVFFFIISWFHSWFQKPYTVELEIPALPESFKSLNERGVKFSETKITFIGQEIPVEVKARFGSWDKKTFSKTIDFAIHQKNDPSMLGYFGIQRKWTLIKPNGLPDRDYSEEVGNAGKDVGTLENPRLYIRYIVNNVLEQDSTNGDRPIMRLLTQIAVEIFQLETDNTLVIHSKDWDADIYIAGGFLYPHLSPDRIIGAIQAARADNKLFPAYRDVGSFDVYLEKSPTNAVSKFVKRNKGQEQPAMVDFDFDHLPITWEEQIAKNRLLPEKGPILPKFFIHDLSRFEKPPQSA